MHAEAGDVDAALSAVELAQVRMDRVPATARAMLGVMRARYLAWGGRPDEARHQIDAADDWFAESDSSTDPPWLCYYDWAEHEGSAGRALIPVAVAAGRPDVAEGRLRAAVRLQAPDYPRSRLFSSLRLTNLIMRTGDPDLAAAEGTQALKLIEGMRSRRIIGELDRLHQAVRRPSGAAQPLSSNTTPSANTRFRTSRRRVGQDGSTNSRSRSNSIGRSTAPGPRRNLIEGKQQ